MIQLRICIFISASANTCRISLYIGLRAIKNIVSTVDRAPKEKIRRENERNRNRKKKERERCVQWEKGERTKKKIYLYNGWIRVVVRTGK